MYSVPLVLLLVRDRGHAGQQVSANFCLLDVLRTAVVATKNPLALGMQTIKTLVTTRRRQINYYLRHFSISAC